MVVGRRHAKQIESKCGWFMWRFMRYVRTALMAESKWAGKEYRENSPHLIAKFQKDC